MPQHSGTSEFIVKKHNDTRLHLIACLCLYFLLVFTHCVCLLSACIYLLLLVVFTFSYFSQGAVDIFNCQQVYATRCVFEHNGPVQTPRNQTFRGQAGGLNVGYNYPRLSTALPPRVIVSDCMFYNNTAEPPLSREVSLSNFLRNIFTGTCFRSNYICL